MDALSLALLCAIAAVIVFFVLQTRRKKSGKSRNGSGAKLAAFVGLGLIGLGLVLFFLLGLIDTRFVTYSLIPPVLGVLVILFALCGLIADMAEAKGRSWAAFFWLSVIFSPLIMWIIAAAISPIAGPSSNGNTAAVSSNSGSPDIAKEIEKLGSLKEQGLITKAEFDAKKKELLDRM